MKSIAEKLLHSAPFVVYISMLILSLVGVQFPKSVYTFTDIVGAANPFLSMLMIGMMFEIKLDKQAMGYVKELFSVRYLISLVCAGAFILHRLSRRSITLLLWRLWLHVRLSGRFSWRSWAAMCSWQACLIL